MSLKPFEAGGMEYNTEALTELRDNIIQLRDAYLKGGDMTWAVILSHNVAILAHIIKEMDDA